MTIERMWLIALTVFIASQQFGDLRRWSEVGSRLSALERVNK